MQVTYEPDPGKAALRREMAFVGLSLVRATAVGYGLQSRHMLVPQRRRRRRLTAAFSETCCFRARGIGHPMYRVIMMRRSVVFVI
jgi:hypothetical protein